MWWKFWKHFSDLKLETTFERIVNVHLLEVESLRLEWCKTKPVPKRQWLAENELGLAQILPFIYSTFFNEVDIAGKANVNEKVPLAIVQMIHSLHVMICMLMSPQKYGKTEIDNAVKLFLSCSHQFAKSYWARNVEPF